VGSHLLCMEYSVDCMMQQLLHNVMQQLLHNVQASWFTMH
jgi:hypothetical protein